MSWGRGTLGTSIYFGKELSRLIDERVARQRENANARDERRLETSRVNQLEDDLARTLLLIQALAEATFAKGLINKAELAEAIQKVDLWDGTADGKLDPAVLRPQEMSHSESGETPEEYLARLEREG